MANIIDHTGLNVSDWARSRAFYVKALEPLGITLIMEFERGSDRVGGFGRDGKPEFWVVQGIASFQKPEQVQVITPIHVGLSARSRNEVDAFHAAALVAGGRDFGAPGPRPVYHANYYGAFVLDPDGHNIEAVCHRG